MKEKVNYLVQREKKRPVSLKGYERFCIGVAHIQNKKPVLCYDLTAIVQHLISENNSLCDALKIVQKTISKKVSSENGPVLLERI